MKTTSASVNTHDTCDVVVKATTVHQATTYIVINCELELSTRGVGTGRGILFRKISIDDFIGFRVYIVFLQVISF